MAGPGAHSVTIRVGTMCSGADMYLTCLPHLRRALQEATGNSLCFHHAWSCEIVRKKREWIVDNFGAERVFTDVMAMTQGGTVYDDVTGQLREVSPVECIIAGFSCKDASRLNCHHKDRLDAVATGEHSTGGTFRAVLDVVAAQSNTLRMVILENVPSLADKHKDTGRSNLDLVREAMHVAGFAFIDRVFDPTDLGLPNRRPRSFMLALPVADEEELRPKEAWAQQAANRTLDGMLQGAVQMHVDDFLLPEYGAKEMMQDWLGESSVAAPRSSKTARPNRGRPWEDSHRQLWPTAPHASDRALYVSSLSGNPWYEILPDREKDLLLLQYCHYPFPGPTDGFVSLNHSASLSRVTSVMPTQLPGAKNWLLARERLQLGVEAICLQGADLVDLPACRPGAVGNRFLQDLAGNSFNLYQFTAWMIVCLSLAQGH